MKQVPVVLFVPLLHLKYVKWFHCMLLGLPGFQPDAREDASRLEEQRVVDLFFERMRNHHKQYEATPGGRSRHSFLPGRSHVHCLGREAEEMHEPRVGLSLRALILLTLLGWLSMIGFDFFLHAGLVARLYLTPSPFLLPATTAFRLIPVGYLSILALALILVWLMIRLRIQRAWPGAVFGLQLGGAMWGAFMLGLFSISTAEPLLLLGWFVGQTVEMAIGGAVIGSGLAGTSLLRLGLLVLALLIALVLLTIGLQLLGLAPAIHA